MEQLMVGTGNAIWGQYLKKYLGIIYATIGIFPNDFDWGYADSDIITPKKSFIKLATGGWQSLIASVKLWLNICGEESWSNIVPFWSRP